MRKWAHNKLRRAADELPRTEAELSTLENKLSFYQGLSSLYVKPEYKMLQDLAKNAIDGIRRKISRLDFKTEEGKLMAIELQSEMKSMEWFTLGSDAIRNRLVDLSSRVQKLRKEREDLEKFVKGRSA